MSIVPKSAKDFSDPLYWKKFFEKHETAFEWYGDYNHLSHIFEKFLKPSDKILQIGCGNSLLSEQLYDNGFRNVVSIDIDSKVIKRHKDNNSKTRPELAFECRSADENGMPDASVNIAIDKGTVDALLPVDFTVDNTTLLQRIFKDVERCLVTLGRYIIVTLAQKHIIEFIIQHFLPTCQFLIRVQKCEFADENFIMPVFVVIIIKMKMPLPCVPNIEFVRQISAKVEKVSDSNELIKLIESEQELNWFKHYVSKNSVEEATIQICGQDGRPRYRLTIVDDMETKTLLTMAAFIVPLGREADWLFSTVKGRKILRKECAKSRIIVVGLLRDQEYDLLANIQSELSGLIVTLKPIGCTENKINFLSLGAVDVKKSIASGTSEKNGQWSVEQINKDGRTFRRLIFLNSAGLVQSEVEVMEIKRGKRNVSKLRTDFLTCDHHRSMLTAVNFLCRNFDGGKSFDGLTELLEARAKPFSFAVLGLGGGLFPKFLYEKFPQAMITTVEFDPDVLMIAQKYFELPTINDRFKVVIDDAQNFLVDNSENSEDNKFDALFIDLAGPVAEDGLSCPPAKFATETSLKLMKDCLKMSGVLAFNLVTRDEDTSKRIKSTIFSVLPNVYAITSDEDVNEVLICPSIFFSLTKNEFIANDAAEEWMNYHLSEFKKLSVVAR